MKPLSYPGMEEPVEPLEEARPKLQPLAYPGMAEETAFLDVVEEAITAGEALAQERIYERNRANAMRVEQEEAEQQRLARLQYSGTPYDPDQGPLGKAAGQGLSVLASTLKGSSTDFGASVLRFGAVARTFLGAETPTDQMWESKAAEGLQNFSNALMPEGPYEENFLNQLGAVVGGGVSYIGTSSATGRFASFVMAKKNMFAKGIQGVDQARKIGELAAKGTGASLGSILTTSGWFQEYKARWPEATDREAAAAAMYGVTMGPLELVGIGRSIGKMFTATEVKSLVRILGTRAAPEAIEEVAQEGIEGAVFEIVAGRIGRNEDYLSKAAWELLPADREDAISAITGALLGTFGGAIDNKSASAYQSLIDGMNEVFLEQDPQTGRWSIAEGKNVNTMTFSLLARRSGLGAREVEASIAILEEFVARNNELSGQQETVDDFLQRTFQSGFTLDKGWQDYKRGLVELLSRGWYLQGTDPSKAADVLLRLGSQDQAEFDGALREISGAVEQEILEGIKAIRPEVATRVVVPKSTRLKSPRGAATAAEMALDLTDGTMLAVAENADFATFVGVLGRHFFQYLPDQVVEEIAGQYGEDLHRVIQREVRTGVKEQQARRTAQLAQPFTAPKPRPAGWETAQPTEEEIATLAPPGPYDYQGTAEVALPADRQRSGTATDGFTGETPRARLEQLYATIRGDKPAFMVWNTYANRELFDRIAKRYGLVRVDARPQHYAPFMRDPDDDQVYTTQVSIYVAPENATVAEELAYLHGPDFPNQQDDTGTDPLAYGPMDPLTYNRRVGELLGYSQEEVESYLRDQLSKQMHIEYKPPTGPTQSLLGPTQSLLGPTQSTYNDLAELPAAGQLLPGEEGEFVSATIRGQKIFMPKGEAFHGRMDQEVETKKLPREQSVRGKGKQLWASASRETARTFGDRIHRLVLKGGAKVFDPMDPENAKQVEDLATEMGTASGQDIKTIETGLKTGYYHDWEQDIPTRWLRKNGYAANLQMEGGKPAVRVLDARQIRTTPDLPVQAGDRAFRARLAGRFGNDFVRYVYEGKAPSRGSKVYFKEFSQLVRKVYGHAGKMPKGTPAPTEGDFPKTVEQALSTMLRRDADLAGGTLTLSGRPYTIHRVKLVEQEVQGKKTIVPVEFADRTKVQQKEGNTYSVLILSGADLQLLGDIAGQKKIKDPKKAAKHQERVARFKAWAATLQENTDYMVDVSFATSGLVMEKNGKVVDAEMLKSLGLRTSAKIPAIRPKFARRFSWTRQELEAATIGELAGLKRQHNIRGPKPDASWSQEKREKLIRLIEHKQELRELYLKKQQLVDNASSWVNLALDAEQLAAAGPAAVRQLWGLFIKEQIDVVRTAGSGKTAEQADVAARAERAVALERRMVGEIAPKLRRFQQMTAADTIVGNRQTRGFIFRRKEARENAKATAWLEQLTRVNGALVTNFALVAEAGRERYDLERVPVNRYRTRHHGTVIEYGVKEDSGAVPSIPQGIQDGALTEVYLKDPPADLLKLMKQNKFQQDKNGVWFRETKIPRPNPYKAYIDAERAAGRWNPPVAVDRIMDQWREIVDITGTWGEQAGLKVYERDRTGKLLEMGLFKKAKGALVFPRQFTEEGLAILLADSDVGRRALADAIRALNPELSPDFIMAQLEELRTRRQSRHIGLEILRTFERMPTHVEIPTFGLGAGVGGKHVVEILESRPAMVADSMVNGIARRIAFMHRDGGAFPQEREAIEQFVQNYTEHEPDFANEHGAAIKNLIRSLNGVPLEDSFLFVPGSPGYTVTQVVQLMMGLWRGRVLGRAALRNLFETSHTTRVYGGTLHWLKASAKVSKALAGGVKKSMMHPASRLVDPTVQDYFAGAMAERAVASGSITDIAALYLFRRHNMLEIAKGFAESFTRTQLNLVGTTGSIQLNELISDVTAREMLASIKRRGRATAFERHTLRDMRMEQAEIDAISAGQGTADMEQKFVTKFVSSTQGTSMRQAERSVAQRTSLVNKNLFFWSYGRMIGDRTMQLADNALKDVMAARRGEGKKLDAVVSVSRLANFGFGALLSGGGGTLLRQLVIYGVFPWDYFYDWDDEEKGGVDDDALAHFVLESMAGALLSGQIEGFIRHNKTEGPSEPLAILARTTAFSAWAQDLYDRLIVPKGEYATMGKLERAVMYMIDFTTSPVVEYTGRGWVQLRQLAGFKALSTGLEDRNLRAAQAAYWDAMRTYAVDKTVVTRLEDSHKDFTRGINMIVKVLESQAMQIDSIEKGDFSKQTTAINEILARQGNDLRRGLELAFGDARDPDSVKRALLGKRYLVGMQKENEAAVLPRLKEKTIDVLNKYDALLTGFANAMGAEK